MEARKRFDLRKWFDMNSIDPEGIGTYYIGGKEVEEEEFWQAIFQKCQEAEKGPERKPLKDGPDLPFWDDGEDDEELDDFARDEVWRD